MQIRCFLTPLDHGAEQPGKLLRQLAAAESAMTVVYLTELPHTKATQTTIAAA